MSRGFYTKLAWTGIKKNRQLYYPYLLAGITMVMVFYIFSFLGESQVVRSLPGKEVLPILFQYGAYAIGLFAIPFLFYANASLIKKRKELGLYNILGMNKKNIFKVLLREAGITYGISVAGGIFAGILFSKIAELGLVNIMDKEVNYRIYVEWKSVLASVSLYSCGCKPYSPYGGVCDSDEDSSPHIYFQIVFGRGMHHRWNLSAVSLCLCFLVQSTAEQ